MVMCLSHRRITSMSFGLLTHNWVLEYFKDVCIIIMEHTVIEHRELSAECNKRDSKPVTLRNVIVIHHDTELQRSW
jgi:hypothetical protein